MRGLDIFLTDLRKCKSKDAELQRINKELANIRSKFKDGKRLNGYQKRKYICKLVFIFLLGHKIDFGLKEAINLLSSNAYSDKQAGYLFISVVSDVECNLMPLVTNALKNDLSLPNDVFQNSALQFIANSSSSSLAESVAEPVINILLSSETSDYIKQSAALALLQVLRMKSDLTLPESTVQVINNLISDSNLGLVTASASLLELLAKKFPFQYESCMAACIVKLSKILSSSCFDLRDYSYYSVAAPWICVKLLRILQNAPAPSDGSLKARLRDALETILRKADDLPRYKRFAFRNIFAKYAVIFEAISLIVHMEFEGYILSRAFNILGATLERPERNIRFMALEMMIRLASNKMYLEHAQLQVNAVLNILQSEPDITVKKKAIDLLYTICSEHSVKRIVGEMLNLLENEHDFSEDVMLQTAALAEQFSDDREWYFDTIINLFQTCGDKVSDSVWYSLVKTVVDNDSIQEYASKASYAALCDRKCHDTVVKLAGYILGEFGYLITNDPRSSYKRQFNILMEKYHKCSTSTKALLLTVFMKFLNNYPDMKEEVQLVLKDACNIQNENVEIQQRAAEYLKLSEIASDSLLAAVLEEMPSSERTLSPIVAAIQNKNTQNFSVSRRNKKNLTEFRSYCDIKSVENVKEVRMTKSISQSNLTHVTFYNNLNSFVDAIQDSSVTDTATDILPRMEKDFKIPKVSKHRSVKHSNLTQTASSKNPNSLANTLQDSATIDAATEMLPKKPKPVRRIANVPNNQLFLYYMLFNEKAKLYENELIAIVIENQFNKHCGRFHLKYMNKTAGDFLEFSIQENFDGDIQNKCSIRCSPCGSKLSASGIMEQDIHLECLSEFSEKPSLILTFVSDNKCNEVQLILPLTLNKFVEPHHITPGTFMARWQSFESLNHQEVVKTFLAKYPMIYGVTREKLRGFRLAVIENGNSENFHCAGVFHTRESRKYFLIRLERNILENKYCSRVRSTQPSLSHVLSNLLCELL